MKISLNWLKQYIDLSENPHEIAAILTDTGLEVESVEPFETVRGSLAGVVVGEVVSRVQHPNADRLSLCTVDAGQGELLQIVCGAPNVAAGQKVVVALIGTTLYPTEGDPITLKKSKIRGVDSQGMICALDELGLGTDHDGIVVLQTNLPNGTPAAQVFDIYEDTVFEIGLTPNRTDAMSHFGVARDLSARLNRPLRKDVRLFGEFTLHEGEACPIKIVVENEQLCPRYSGVYLSGVKVGESPAWLKNFLCAIGQRPINNIVDITNYVLFSIAQPLHAFDADKIAQKTIVVKPANEGEKFTTLDEKERTLSSNDLMICDAEKPLCLAGVMGGLNSGVTENTTNIFIESAYFQPDSIRKTARRHGLHSETSYRFERGTDPNSTPDGLALSAALANEISDGKASMWSDVKTGDFSPTTIPFSYNKANRLIGANLSKDEINDLFKRLGIEIRPTENDDVAEAAVPLYRADVKRQQDLVEELLRIYGYNKIEFPSFFSMPANYETSNLAYDLQERVADYLTASGFYEIRTNSLVNRQYQTATSVNMQNPMSEETAVMRETLIRSGLEVIAHNTNRKENDLKLYEFGKIYGKTANGSHERTQLTLFLTGLAAPQHWQSKPEETDFFSLKREIQKIVGWFALDAREETAAETGAEFAYERRLIVGKQTIARFGQISVEWSKVFDLKQPVYAAIVEWDLLLPLYNKRKIEFAELPRFPIVKRDLSMNVAGGITFEQIEQWIFGAGKKLIQSVDIFDVYQHPQSIERSYAVSINLYNPEKTLDEKEIAQTMDKIMQKLELQQGLTLRKA